MHQTASQNSNALLSLVKRADESGISSIKGIIAGILGVISDADSTPLELKNIIEVDPPLAARVLKVANSPFYGSPRTLSEIDQAIVWIGFDALKEIVITQKCNEIFTSHGKEVAGLTRAMLWRHSLAVALFAKLIYRWEFGKKGAGAYTAGLLHDFGFIVLDQLLHNDFAEILREGTMVRQSIEEIEQKRLGFDHAMVGGILAEHWNFPGELSAGISHHHSPQNASSEHALLAQVLFIADCLAFNNELWYGGIVHGDDKQCHSLCLALNLSEYALNRIIEQMRIELAQIDDKGYFK
ncbi:MAG: hypothetical protein A2511_10420 [Deltaproteobacteria bacterium RIFOXYD12_FULL_50_9]|nr:MAG: hypothetical protein A2511_10420 [Deltaproteobacteria bacterium RIFOXYD12_FULL_50_9]